MRHKTLKTTRILTLMLLFIFTIAISTPLLFAASASTITIGPLIRMSLTSSEYEKFMQCINTIYPEEYRKQGIQALYTPLPEEEFENLYEVLNKEVKAHSYYHIYTAPYNGPASEQTSDLTIVAIGRKGKPDRDIALLYLPERFPDLVYTISSYRQIPFVKDLREQCYQFTNNLPGHKLDRKLNYTLITTLIIPDICLSIAKNPEPLNFSSRRLRENSFF